MRSRSAKSVISPTCSFAPVIASPRRETAEATSGSLLISSTLRPTGAGGGAGEAGGGLGGVISDISYWFLVDDCSQLSVVRCLRCFDPARTLRQPTTDN